MKKYYHTINLFLLALAVGMPCLVFANENWQKDKQIIIQLEQYSQRAKKLSREQDELSADLQELTDLLTNPEVITFMREIEINSTEISYWLEQEQTGGDTQAAQTEIIEKIYQAAKSKTSSSSSQGQKGKLNALMKMLQYMIEGGRNPAAPKNPTQGQAHGGSGQGAPEKIQTADKTESIFLEKQNDRVPKSTGGLNNPLPEEFRKAMNAYNKAIEKEIDKQ